MEYVDGLDDQPEVIVKDTDADIGVDIPELPATVRVIPDSVEDLPLPGIFALARLLCRQARSFLPRGCRKPGQVVAIILTGRELGIGPMQSLRALWILRGKVSATAELQLAIALREGVRHEWMERSSERAAIRLYRPDVDDEGEVFEWTAEDARVAGLLGKENWRKYQRKMLCWRVVSEAIDLYCPDVMLGVYTPGELDGFGAIDVDAEYVGDGLDNYDGLDDDEDDLDDEEEENDDEPVAEL